MVDMQVFKVVVMMFIKVTILENIGEGCFFSPKENFDKGAFRFYLFFSLSVPPFHGYHEVGIYRE